jgi:predicted ATPase
VITRQYVSEIRLRREDVPSFERYPFSLPAVRHLDVLALHPQVTFFVGENGSGKSTLLEAIAVSWGFNAEGGTKNFRFGTRISHSDLEQYIRLSKGVRRPKDGFFLRAESFFNVATEIEKLDAEPAFSPPVIDSYGGRSLHEQSHGESFMALLMNRFGGNGFYILDEPEAAVSPQRQLAVLARIHDLVMDDSQLSLDPANRAVAIDHLAKEFGLERGLTERTYDALADPDDGLFADARIDVRGIEAVLALRVEAGLLPDPPLAPSKYYL